MAEPLVLLDGCGRHRAGVSGARRREPAQSLPGLRRQEVELRRAQPGVQEMKKSELGPSARGASRGPVGSPGGQCPHLGHIRHGRGLGREAALGLAVWEGCLEEEARGSGAQGSQRGRRGREGRRGRRRSAAAALCRTRREPRGRLHLRHHRGRRCARRHGRLQPGQPEQLRLRPGEAGLLQPGRGLEVGRLLG